MSVPLSRKVLLIAFAALVGVKSGDAFGEMKGPLTVVPQISDLNRVVHDLSSSNALCDSCSPQAAPVLTQAEVIETCLKRSAQKSGSWKKVSYVKVSPCDDHTLNPMNLARFNKVGYRIRRENGKIEIAASIFFHYRGLEKNREMTLKHLQEIKPCVTHFFERFGIRMQLDFKTDGSVSDYLASDRSINLWDSYPRATSENWTLRSKTRGDPFGGCETAAHEFSHLLGLDDQYPEPACPSRKIGPADSVMNDCGESGLSKNFIYPSDLAIIIKPLCP